MPRKSTRNRASALLALAVVCLTGEMFSQMNFRGGRDINLPEFNGPVTVATADFNGDGAMDVAVGNAFAASVSILLGVGDSLAGFVHAGTFPAGFHPFSIAVQDYNNDYFLDMALANYGFESQISVLLGNGDGTFRPRQSYEVGAPPTTLIAQDLNNDNHLDLAVACLGPFVPDQPELANRRISILLGDGRGGFSPPTCGRDFLVGLAPEGIEGGDFDFDGNGDLAVANLFSDEVTVLLGNGTGCFPNNVNYPVQRRPSTVVVGDYNNDFIADLVTINEASFSISLLTGIGDGRFQAARHFPNPPSPAYGVRILGNDFNMDANLDIAIAGATDEARIILGDGQGRFIEPIRSFRTGANICAQVAAGDFNGDSLLDLVAANKGTGPPPPPPTRAGNVTVFTGDGKGNLGTFLGTPGESPSAIAPADFNGDRFPDLAVALKNTNAVWILIGYEQGSLYSSLLIPVGNRPVALVSGDFNSDGRLDLATANAGSNSVTIRLGDGGGDFPAGQDFTVGAEPNDLTIGDFNRDGRPDLAVANKGSNNLTVLLGNGTGAFPTRRDFPAGSQPLSIRSGDFNNDGRLDLAIANSVSNNATVLLGDGAGNFPTRFDTALSAGARPFSLALGRFNADNNLDMAVANNGANNLTLLLGDGSGRFPTSRTIGLSEAQGVSYISSADFDGDAKLDLAVVNTISNSVAILRGDGNGNFTEAITPSPLAGVNPTSVAVSDFNGDSRPDLICTNSGSNTVSIVYNYTTR